MVAPAVHPVLENPRRRDSRHSWKP